VIGASNSVETATEWNPTHSYDEIGNRKESTGFTDATYIANELNQCSLIRTESLSGQVLETNPTYDPDGNLISDGDDWFYTWNNENHLVSARDGRKTLDFTYDYQGRLVKKDDGTTIEVYLYDGWNRIASFDIHSSALTLQSSYLWGLDLSGTMQGAGGVGGLLKEGNLYPTYDANGNVMQKLDMGSETDMSATYDPFGNIIEGMLVGEYGFSTKPLIDDLDWYYYGFRYYDPVTGRWPNRDPIGEGGGLNLYGMVNNNPVNHWDLLGQKPPCSDYSKTRGSGDSAEGRTTTQSGNPTGNGCGASGSSFRPPQGHFRVSFVAACNAHDRCYGTCGASKDGCDRQFRANMRAACDAVYNRFNIPARASCYATAHTYYLAVRHAGGSAFEAAQDQFCKWEPCCE